MQLKGKIVKAADERLAFGWASVAADKDGVEIVDAVGDVIPIAELEQAAYKFVAAIGTGGEMHERTGVATLIESVVFSADKLKMLGLEGQLPQGWWVGFKVEDESVWQKIKDGTYTMFSIGGRAKRSERSE